MSKAERKQKIVAIAKAQGADDVLFVKYPLDGDFNVAAFLIKRYLPTDGSAPHGHVAVSSYYFCSHAVYTAGNAFADAVTRELGILAKPTNDLQYKRTVMQAGGGKVGLNTIYYHPKFGSYVSMRCVLIKADIATDEAPQGKTVCADCTACIQACPIGALTKQGFNRKKCLRNMVSAGFDTEERRHFYQLLGCEKCQTCCPMNDAKLTCAYTVPLLPLLKNQLTYDLKQKVGRNFATRSRLLTQGMVLAVNQNYKAALPAIEDLKQDDMSTVAKTAKWAHAELDD